MIFYNFYDFSLFFGIFFNFKQIFVFFVNLRKFLIFLEESGVWKIIKSVKLKRSMCKGRKGYNPYKLLAAIVYCFAKFKASLRDIEDKCLFDIRVLYIMDGNIPDHSTFGNFINDYIVPYQYEIFTTIVKHIIKKFNLKEFFHFHINMFSIKYYHKNQIKQNE